MKHFILRTSSYAPLLFLHLFFLLVVITNLHPNEWFMGWDSLHPELNFPLNFWRGVHSSWQGEYGLGTLTGHGFGSTLPHTIVIWILSFVFKLNQLRQVLAFICLYGGMMGAFVLMSHLVKSFGTSRRESLWISSMVALGYVTHFANVQHFYVELEAFVIHFATFPWVVWTVIAFLDQKSPKRSHYVVPFVVFVISSAQGFIPPLFVLTSVLLFIVFATQSMYMRSWRSIVRLGFIYLFANLYWLIPLVYYTLTRSPIYLDSYANLTTTPEYIEKSFRWGSLYDTVAGNGLYRDSTYFGKPILSMWLPTFDSWLAKLTVCVTSLVALVGVIYVIKKRFWWGVALVLFLFVTLSLLTVSTQPFALIGEFLRFINPIFRQSFRIGFTKLSVGMSLMQSIFFGFGIVFLFQKVSETLKISFIVLFIVARVILYFPALQGNFFYSQLITKLPAQYSQLADYLRTQDPNSKVLELPLDCYEGWYTTSWGYFGSGFLQYAIPQSILSRSFDVWSRENESMYLQFRRVILNESSSELLALLSKYHVRWITYDTSQLHCRNQKAYKNNEAILEKLRGLILPEAQHVFDGGHQDLPVYLFDAQSQINIHNPTVYSTFRGATSATDYDGVYDVFGSYFTDESSPPTFPFVGIYSGRAGPTLAVKTTSVSISGKSSPIHFAEGGTLVLPPLNVEKIIPVVIRNLEDVIEIDFITPKIMFSNGVDLFPKKQIRIPIKAAEVSLNDKKISSGDTLYTYMSLSAPTNIFSKNFDGTARVIWSSESDKVFESFSNSEFIKIDSLNNDMLTFDFPKLGEFEELSKFFSFTDVSAEGCYVKNNIGRLSNKSASMFYIEAVDTDQCIILHTKPLQMLGSIFADINAYSTSPFKPRIYVSNIQGVHLSDLNMDQARKFFIHVPNNHSSELDVYLKIESFSNLRPSNLSFKQASFSYFPYEFVQGIHFVPDGANSSQIFSNFQSFDQGWLAYDLTGANWLQRQMPVLFANSLRLKDHVLVNNWANGWRLGEGSSSKLQDPSNIQGSNEETRNNEIGNSGGGVDPGFRQRRTSLSGMTEQGEIVTPDRGPGQAQSTTPRNDIAREIVIIFWPQYLQYLGFAVLLVTMGVLIMPRHLRVTR